MQDRRRKAETTKEQELASRGKEPAMEPIKRERERETTEIIDGKRKKFEFVNDKLILTMYSIFLIQKHIIIFHTVELDLSGNY